MLFGNEHAREAEQADAAKHSQGGIAHNLHCGRAQDKPTLAGNIHRAFKRTGGFRESRCQQPWQVALVEGMTICKSIKADRDRIADPIQHGNELVGVEEKFRDNLICGLQAWCYGFHAVALGWLAVRCWFFKVR